MNNARETFLTGTAFETSAAITGAGFTNGEIGAFRLSGVNTGTVPVMTVGAQDFPCFFAQKQTGDLAKGSKKSYVINSPWHITRVGIAGYRAESPMTKFIGYDGSDATKTLSYDCETDYGIKFVIDSPYVRKYYISYAGGGLKKTIHITTDCCEDCDAGCGTAVCTTETAKFVEKINDTNPEDSGIAFSIYNQIYAEQMALGATNTALDGAATLSVTNGSTTVTASGAQTTDWAVGTILRIGGTTEASPVYILTEITSTTVAILNTPYQGTTNAAIAGETVTGVTACGIKITGKFVSSTTGCCCFPPFPWDVDGVTFIIANPEIGKLPCSALTITDGNDLTMGQGTYRQMQYAEMYAAGYSDMRQFFQDCAFNNYTSYLTSTATYDVMYLEYIEPIDNPHDPLVSQTPIRITFACPTVVAGVSAVDVDTNQAAPSIDSSDNTMLDGLVVWTNGLNVSGTGLNPNLPLIART